MQPIVNGCHRRIIGKVGPRSTNDLRSNEQVSVGKIDVSVSGSGYAKFYRATRIRVTLSVDVLSSDPHRCSAASVVRRINLVRFSHLHTIAGVRMPYYEKTSSFRGCLLFVRTLRLIRFFRCSSFHTFTGRCSE